MPNTLQMFCSMTIPIVRNRDMPSALRPLPDGERLGDLIEVVERVALVLEVDGGGDQRLEVVRVPLLEHLRSLKAVTQIVLAPLALVLPDAMEPCGLGETKS